MSILDRVRNLGIRSASAIDLLSIALSRRESDIEPTEATSRQILARFKGIHRLADLSYEDLREFAGLEGFEATQRLAMLELGRRVGGVGRGPVTAINDPGDVAILLEFLSHEKREHFVAVLLDSKNQVQKTATIHIGTVNMSIVGPREVFREAIREGASSLIVAHNHPSGDPTPSPEDIEVTRRLVEVGALLDIPVLDHVIIGERRWTSLANEGYV